MNTPQQAGQGLAEYAIVLVLITIAVFAVIALGYYLILAGLVAPHWETIVAKGSELVAGIQRGEPSSIFTAVILTVAYLYLLRRGILAVVIFTTILLFILSRG